MANRTDDEPWTMEWDGDGYLINGIVRVPPYEGYHDDARLMLAAPRLLAMVKRLMVHLNGADSFYEDVRRDKADVEALIAELNAEPEDE